MRTEPDSLPRAVEKALFRRYQQGDVSARQRLVEHHLPLARRLARRYERPGSMDDDLVQVASLGLLKAVDRFDPARGEFVAYAIPTILGELRRYFRDARWSIHMPRTLQEHVVRLPPVVEELTARLGRSPTTEEIAELLGITSEEVLEAREAARAFSAISLDAPVRSADEPAALVDLLGEDDERYDTVEYSAALETMLAGITPLEREVLRLRFDEDLRQSEIGERIGVSQMQVSRLLRRTIETLQQQAAAA